jgi:tRNA nucleotidyltransferase (CCA-adding enzyme)
METLQENGFQAYLVGGGVRDILMNLEPKDYDICTDALPQQVKNLFNKVIPTGEKHGTVTVVLPENKIEVTTFRQDGDYQDCRHPEEVVFTRSLQEDVARRDFTMNSIAININKRIFDYFNGVQSIENKCIVTVNNPDDRFKEDALRMMRAIRFAVQLDFKIEENTKQSILKNSNLITYVSQERIRDELCKILLSDYPSRGIKLLRDCGLLIYIIPELQRCVNFDQQNIHHNKNVFDHVMAVLDDTPKDLIIRLSALLHDIAKPIVFTVDENNNGHFYKHHLEGEILTEEILKRLKFDNKTINTVKLLVRHHMDRYEFLRTSNIKKFINRVGVENLESLFILQVADIKGSAPPHDFSGIEKLKEDIQVILSEKQPLTIKDLKINGYDLMELGFKPGKQMGDILDNLLEMVLENPNLNNKDSLVNVINQSGWKKVVNQCI